MEVEVAERQKVSKEDVVVVNPTSSKTFNEVLLPHPSTLVRILATPKNDVLAPGASVEVFDSPTKSESDEKDAQDEESPETQSSRTSVKKKREHKEERKGWSKRNRCGKNCWL